MSDIAKLKDSVSEFHKAIENIDNKLKEAVEEHERTREETEARLNHPT